MSLDELKLRSIATERLFVVEHPLRQPRVSDCSAICSLSAVAYPI